MNKRYWAGIGLAATSAMAEPGEVQVGRYSALAPVATQEQLEPLAEVIEPTFAAGVTLRQALQAVLDDSGYRLAAAENSDPGMTSLLQQSLPRTQQSFGPITRERSLQAFAGSAFRLVVDRVHRLVSFERTASYRHYQTVDTGDTLLSGQVNATEPDRFGLREAPGTEIIPLPETEPRYAMPRKAKSRSTSTRKPPHHQETYGPVHRHETLQSIAKRLVHHTSITPDTMMIGLFQKNPQAFYRRNRHQLKTGSVLKIPQKTTLLALSRQQARQANLQPFLSRKHRKTSLTGKSKRR